VQPLGDISHADGVHELLRLVPPAEEDDKKVPPPTVLTPFKPVKFDIVSNPMRGMVRANMIFSFRLGSALTISSSGAGAINSLIPVSNVTSSPGFASFAGIFDEYFISTMRSSYMPVSRYNYPLTGTSALSVSSLPIGVANTYHTAPNYTSLAAMANNGEYAFRTTSDPFVHTWKNNEDPKAGAVEAYGTSPTQSWALTTGTAAYSGVTQFLSLPAPPALPVSQVVGNFTIEWTVLFRARR